MNSANSAVLIAIAIAFCTTSCTKDTAPKPTEPWRTDESVAFADAKASKRHIVVDFRADWCRPCVEVEAILAKPTVYAELTETFVPLAFDVTNLTPEDNETKARYRVFNLPAVVFVDHAGVELGRFEGEPLTAEAFLDESRRVAAKHPLE